jgi:DNA-binding transcriptional LysR family regulator
VVETVVGAAPDLAEKLGRGELDLRVAYEPQGRFPVLWSDTRPMAWIGPGDFARDPAAPLPLVLFDPPCTFRTAAIRALEDAGLAWTIAYQSPTLAGLWAAVASGLGVTVRTPSRIPGPLRVLEPEWGLPALPPVSTTLEAAPGKKLGPAPARLAELLVRSLEATSDGPI